MTDTSGIDRIPLAHSVRYVAHGLPEVPNQYGPGVLAPSEITLTYRAAPDSQLGRVHAYVAGRIWVDGTELPLQPGGLYGQHYDDGLDGWPEWLAEEARLHDPERAAAPAVVEPPANQTTCRDRIAAAALAAVEAALGDTLVPAAREEALAGIAAVLPEPTDRAASDLEIARTTNQRLNREKQRLESELAAYRRAVSQWEISERGTYIPHASLRAIGLASGKDILGSVRHLKHFERVEQAEAEVERLRADRAAALREAALHLYTALFPAVYDDMGQKAAEGVNRAVSELRRMADETATETPPADPWSISYHQLSPARNNPAVCTCGLGPTALMHNEPPHPFNGRPKPGMPPVTGICTDCHHHETAACHQPAAGGRQDGAGRG